MIDLRALAGRADRFAVVDTETTGVYDSDRVVEVAVVTVGLDGQILDTYETLLQPDRDVSAGHIHHITASMVEGAPRFADVAGDIGIRLHGACLVAHNASFDLRMLRNEYKRAELGLEAAPVDTLSASGGRLGTVCADLGIGIEHAHSALDDALACSQLLLRVAERCHPGEPATVTPAQRSGRVLRRRDTVPAQLEDPPLIAYLASRLDLRGVEARFLAYLELVERIVADLHLDREERHQLADLATELGLNHADRRMAHRRYVNELIDAALADRVLTPDEYDQLLRVESMLDLDEGLVDERTRAWRTTTASPRTLEPGTEIVFTGDDPERPRAVLKAHATSLGFTVHSGVRKKTGLLVAFDAASRSGKAKKAADYDIPIVSTADFAALGPGAALSLTTSDDDLAARKVITCPQCLTNRTAPASQQTRQEQFCAECAEQRNSASRQRSRNRAASPQQPVPPTDPRIGQTR